MAPPSENGAGAGTAVTYHDPCHIGRHNGVYDPPQELIGALPGVTLTEMPRHGNLSFCCGAGGARMWMEEKLGTRINGNRTEEAVATGADQIAVACPFCRVMLSDALTSQQAAGSAPESVEGADVAQMLLAAVWGRTPPDPAAPTPCVPECTSRAGVLVSGPLECTSARKADSGPRGGGGAGEILKKI